MARLCALEQETAGGCSSDLQAGVRFETRALFNVAVPKVLGPDNMFNYEQSKFASGYDTVELTYSTSRDGQRVK